MQYRFNFNVLSTFFYYFLSNTPLKRESQNYCSKSDSRTQDLPWRFRFYENIFPWTLHSEPTSWSNILYFLVCSHYSAHPLHMTPLDRRLIPPHMGFDVRLSARRKRARKRRISYGSKNLCVTATREKQLHGITKFSVSWKLVEKLGWDRNGQIPAGGLYLVDLNYFNRILTSWHILSVTMTNIISS